MPEFFANPMCKADECIPSHQRLQYCCCRQNNVLLFVLFCSVLGFRKDEYLNHSKTIESCLYLLFCSNKVKFFATEVPALASPKIARQVHRLLVHCASPPIRYLNIQTKQLHLYPTYSSCSSMSHAQPPPPPPPLPPSPPAPPQSPHVCDSVLPPPSLSLLSLLTTL